MLHTLDETLDKIVIDKYKSFIDEYEEEHEKMKNELETLKILVENFFKYILYRKTFKNLILV